ncbi:hypothetical protein HYY75_08740 [bacterium]|nr:hypothetical protein [bacterium]
MDSEKSLAPNPERAFQVGRLFWGVLLSLLVCPGLGQRSLGRPFAFKVIFVAFIISSLIFCFSVFQIVQSSLQQLSNPPNNPEELYLFLQATVKTSVGSMFGGMLMVGIYFFAPIELIYMEIFFYLSKKSSNAKSGNKA